MSSFHDLMTVNAWGGQVVMPPPPPTFRLEGGMRQSKLASVSDAYLEDRGQSLIQLGALFKKSIARSER